MYRVRVPASASFARLPLLLSLLAAAAILPALGCGTSLPERVRAAGVAAYSPVPSDALPVRRADADATTRLAAAVHGLRYARAAGEFSLAPAAFSDVVPRDMRIATRDAIRIGEVRIFWVAAEALAQSDAQRLGTFSDEQVAALQRGQRVPVTVAVEVPPRGAFPDKAQRIQAFVERIRATLRRGIQLGLERLYGNRTIPAHGRVFLLSVEPEVEPDPQPLPRDPVRQRLRPDEYRYRLGQGFRSPESRRLIMHLMLWVLPDVPIR